MGAVGRRPSFRISRKHLALALFLSLTLVTFLVLGSGRFPNTAHQNRPLLATQPLNKSLTSAPVLSSEVVQQLATLVNHPTNVLNDTQIQAGIIYTGTNTRTRRLVHKLLTGEPVIVATLGGSITANMGADGYPDRVLAWLDLAFPVVGRGKHALHNGGIGGVQSKYFSTCLKWHVPLDVDLVLVELSVNDNDMGMESRVRRAYERMLRKLLNFPHRPSVVLLQTNRNFESPQTGYRDSSEDEMGIFAQYYGLPWLSFRAVTWHEHHRGQKGYAMADFLLGGDGFHPNARGHGVLTDLVTGLLTQTAQQLLLMKALGADDEDRAAWPLPVPLLPGNQEYNFDHCVMDGKFKDLVADQHSGFEWTDEGKAGQNNKKLGYVSNVPGSWIQFTVNTARTAVTSIDNPFTLLILSHLRSYENMGQARVTCTGGCTCEENFIEGHWEQKTSQLDQHSFSVSQAEECSIRIEVLNSSLSGAHKVKIQGVIISDEATKKDDEPRGEGIHTDNGRAVIPELLSNDA